MKISEVKTAKKVGRFVIRNDGKPNKIKAVYENGFQDNKLPKVYIFAVGKEGEDKEIYKIGVTSGKLKSAMSFYQNARTGRPGRPRFILHELIFRELQSGKAVEIYMISSPPVQAVKICGLFDCDQEVEISASNAMEKRCLEDYKSREGRYPPWNFKENKQTYPEDIEREFNKYHQDKLDQRQKT